MRRKIIALCGAFLLLLTCVCTALAEGVEPDKTGSISVTLTEPKQKEPMVGAELSLYLVAAVRTEAGEPLICDYTEEFKPLGAALDDKDLAEKLERFVAKRNVPFVKRTTNAEGTALWEALPLGLYFVRQTGTVEGFAPCTPFIVTVPGKEGDGYVYEVNASPKTEVEKFTSVTVKKVWNIDPSTKAAESVTVQLLKDAKVLKTAVLNEENRWQITYTDLPESDGYSIQEVNIPKGFTASYQQEGTVFTVTNTATLIETGQLIWPIPVLAGAGLLLMVFGIGLLRKKRNTNE